jgi:uncharacterized SAM-binding protein YcdF (DUF218 family)
MDSLFFTLSKLLWSVTRPDHLMLLLLTIGFLLLRSGLTQPRSKAVAFGYGLTATLILCLWITALYPVGELLLHPLEKRFAPPQVLTDAEGTSTEVAGVVVLGGAEDVQRSAYWKTPEFNESAERNLALLYLLERYPEAQFIFTGGSGLLLDQSYRGGDIVYQLLRQFGQESRVIIERESRNTDENARYSKPLADLKQPGRWLLVTSAFHMPRSIGIFRKQGWDMLPYPVDYRSLPPLSLHWDFDLTGHLREWLGLFVYWQTGKTDALFPGNQNR